MSPHRRRLIARRTQATAAHRTPTHPRWADAEPRGHGGVNAFFRAATRRLLRTVARPHPGFPQPGAPAMVAAFLAVGPDALDALPRSIATAGPDSAAGRSQLDLAFLRDVAAMPLETRHRIIATACVWAQRAARRRWSDLPVGADRSLAAWGATQSRTTLARIRASLAA